MSTRSRSAAEDPPPTLSERQDREHSFLCQGLGAEAGRPSVPGRSRWCLPSSNVSFIDERMPGDGSCLVIPGASQRETVTNRHCDKPSATSTTGSGPPSASMNEPPTSQPVPRPDPLTALQDHGWVASAVASSGAHLPASSIETTTRPNTC